MESTWTCKYCDSKFLLKNKFTKSGHLSGCKKYKEWVNLYLSREFLEQEYIINKKSLPEIAAQLGLEHVSAIYNRLKFFNIKSRSVSESCPISVEKRKKTNLERYGAEFPLDRNSSIRTMMEAHVLEKYGVINVFQLDFVKDKIKATCLEKYGYDCACKSPEIRKKQQNTLFENHGVYYTIDLMRKNNDKYYSKPHRKVVEVLASLGFSPKIEKSVQTESSLYYFDIYFENNNKLIEINGDFFHANPIKYKESDYIPLKKMYVKDIWEYDLKKIRTAESLGYLVLTIWENEINKDIESVKRKVLEFLNENY